MPQLTSLLIQVEAELISGDLMVDLTSYEFHHKLDRGMQEVSGLHLRTCQFVCCSFSLTREISNQSTARDLKIENCHACDCDVGPGIVEDVTIENLSTDGPLICWSTFLRRVVITGHSGPLLINRAIHAGNVDPDLQREFDLARGHFYAQTDWALDISEARIEELSISGIPTELIRRDPDRHFVITKESVLRQGWREHVRSKNDHWLHVINWFLEDGDDSTILAVPEGGVTRREQRDLKNALLELRDLGVVS